MIRVRDFTHFGLVVIPDALQPNERVTRWVSPGLTCTIAQNAVALARFYVEKIARTPANAYSSNLHQVVSTLRINH